MQRNGGWPKYQCPPDMLTVESMTSSMQLTPDQVREQMMEVIDQQMAMAKTPEEKQAWANIKVRKYTKRLDTKIKEAFVEDFVLWIDGRSPYNVVSRLETRVGPDGHEIQKDVKYTPWGNKSMSFLPGARKLLESPILNRDKVITTLTKLICTNPRNIDELWIYYKYLVRKVGIDVNENTVKEQHFYNDYDYLEKNPMMLQSEPEKDADGNIIPGQMHQELVDDPAYTELNTNNPKPKPFNQVEYDERKEVVLSLARNGDIDILDTSEFAGLSPEDKLYMLQIARITAMKQLSRDAKDKSLADDVQETIDIMVPSLPDEDIETLLKIAEDAIKQIRNRKTKAKARLKLKAKYNEILQEKDKQVEGAYDEPTDDEEPEPMFEAYKAGRRKKLFNPFEVEDEEIEDEESGPEPEPVKRKRKLRKTKETKREESEEEEIEWHDTFEDIEQLNKYQRKNVLNSDDEQEEFDELRTEQEELMEIEKGRKAAEETRKRQAEETRRREEAEEARKRQAEETRRRKAEETRKRQETRRRKAEETRKIQEAEEARKKEEAEETRRQEAEEARKRQEDEETRRREENEEEEKARIKAEQKIIDDRMKEHEASMERRAKVREQIYEEKQKQKTREKFKNRYTVPVPPKEVPIEKENIIPPENNHVHKEEDIVIEDVDIDDQPNELPQNKEPEPPIKRVVPDQLSREEIDKLKKNKNAFTKEDIPGDIDMDIGAFKSYIGKVKALKDKMIGVHKKDVQKTANELESLYGNVAKSAVTKRIQLEKKRRHLDSTAQARAGNIQELKRIDRQRDEIEKEENELVEIMYEVSPTMEDRIREVSSTMSPLEDYTAPLPRMPIEGEDPLASTKRQFTYLNSEIRRNKHRPAVAKGFEGRKIEEQEKLLDYTTKKLKEYMTTSKNLKDQIKKTNDLNTRYALEEQFERNARDHVQFAKDVMDIDRAVFDSANDYARDPDTEEWEKDIDDELGYEEESEPEPVPDPEEIKRQEEIQRQEEIKRVETERQRKLEEEEALYEAARGTWKEEDIAIENTIDNESPEDLDLLEDKYKRERNEPGIDQRRAAEIDKKLNTIKNYKDDLNSRINSIRSFMNNEINRGALKYTTQAIAPYLENAIKAEKILYEGVPYNKYDKGMVNSRAQLRALKVAQQRIVAEVQEVEKKRADVDEAAKMLKELPNNNNEYYTILGLTPGQSQQSIDEALKSAKFARTRKLYKEKYHPDKHHGASEEELKKLYDMTYMFDDAVRVIGNPLFRASYDAVQRGQRQQQQQWQAPPQPQYQQYQQQPWWQTPPPQQPQWQQPQWQPPQPQPQPQSRWEQERIRQQQEEWLRNHNERLKRQNKNIWERWANQNTKRH